MAANQEAISPSAAPPPLLRPGHNCWRIEHAHRFALLIDADAYFRAVRAAIRAARHSVFILSWDIDSRMLLVPEGANDGYPEPLGEFLHAVVAERPELHVYVLNWDFAMLYALEREWLPAYKPGWSAHPRLEFFMDGRHPVGASHHQKVVVIDDAVAFVGGLDLTRCRWDTPEHACDAPLRCDADGRTHAPFHDVQAMADDGVARALGELARVRWQRAAGRGAVPARRPASDPWPQRVAPDMADLDIAIARTEPAFGGRPGIDEVRQLHLDAIAAARSHLFFENQYFTSAQISAALAERLSEADGPDIVVVMPMTQSGWLEDVTMGVLRARLHRFLKAADRHDRYRLYCPYLPGLDGACLNVHSKVFCVDDDLFSVGSANLSNRSMAFDTECNLVIEATGNPAAGDPARRQALRAGIARLRNRLLGEHLAVAPEAIEAAMRERSLIASIEALRRPGRTLLRLEPELPPDLDALVPDYTLIDPERPMKPEELAAYLVPAEAHRPVPRRLVALGIAAVTLAVLALAWRWTPLRDWLNLGALVAFARTLDILPFTPLAIMAAYVIAGLLVVPVTLMIAVTGIVFGPLQGSLYAIAGTMLSAAATYGLGHWLGRDTMTRLLGARINRLSKRIARRGIIAMLVVRILPVAPFSIVNMIAGASHIRFRDYMLGTAIGMTPGIAITVTFVHHLAEAIRNPSFGAVAVLALVTAALFGAAVALQRLLGGKKEGGMQ
ncbi:MAG TPA: VTT domain-containing protein [Paucimonas sp.]|nr:VTT domain-containing protein [Paucimonas sp.]